MTDDPFVTHRSLLFTVAYEILGSAVDAEDVLQESWLRWAQVDRDEVRDPRAYLVRVVTRQALNQVRTLARRREDYVGEWLPEPLLTTRDVAEDVELSESLSIAMLTILETLSPTERAVFVLHEVFDVQHDEIADAVGKTPAAVRQIVHRARAHVAARRPRVRASRREQERAAQQLVAALNAGDLQGLLDVLAPEVVLVVDGGGVSGAAKRPVVGRDRLVTLLMSGAGRLVASMTQVNGRPAVRVDFDGALGAAIDLVVENGRITRILSIVNPAKLARLETAVPLAR